MTDLNTDPVSIIIGLLLAVSEALALIPQIKSNSILQLIVSVIKRAAGK